MPSSTLPQNTLWIVTGDIHDDVRRLKEIPELNAADGILVTGDLTLDGGPQQAGRVLDALQQAAGKVLAQVGNMDHPDVTDMLRERGCNLHTEVREAIAGVAFFGIGGSTPTPFNTPCEYAEDRYAAWLDTLWQKASGYTHTVLVSHTPPKDTVCDALPNGMHVGSTAVRAFLEKAQPQFCLCGHIHEGVGIDRLGRTVIMNPGTLADGGYILLRLCQGVLTAELRHLS